MQLNAYANAGGQYYLGTKLADRFDIACRTSGGAGTDMQMIFVVHGY